MDSEASAPIPPKVAFIDELSLPCYQPEDSPYMRSSRSKSRKTASRPTVKQETTPVKETDNGRSKEADRMNGSEGNNSDTDEFNKREPMTQLQSTTKFLPPSPFAVLIINAIDKQNGAATFDQIYEYVNKVQIIFDVRHSIQLSHLTT